MSLEWKLLTKKRGSSTHLEGEALRVIHLGHTDTAHWTGLHLPSIDLVVSGDCVYNNTHLYLAECDEKARSEWLRALDGIESLASEGSGGRTWRARSR